MNYYLGIDIGVTGALALLDQNGNLIAVHDMPVLQDGPAGRRTINGILLAQLIRTLPPIKEAYIELVGPRPKEGPVGAFAFGRSRGTIEGVLAGLEIPAKNISPAAWKRVIGLPPGKDEAKDKSRSEAIRRWPAQADKFKRKKDDGRSDSALIGVAGIAKNGAKVDITLDF